VIPRGKKPAKFRKRLGGNLVQVPNFVVSRRGDRIKEVKIPFKEGKIIFRRKRQIREIWGELFYYWDSQNRELLGKEGV